MAAHGSNREIGKNNDLLWHIPADLRHFKKTTSGHSVIMGRSTFESVGSKPLKDRRNIILTKDKEFHAEKVEICHSIKEAIKLVKDEEEVFVLGGGKIYEQMLHMVDKMYLTIVHKTYEADTYFPDYDLSEWKEVERTDVTDDEIAGVDYSFITYKRKGISKNL